MAFQPGGFLTFRYKAAKLKDAAEEFLFTVFKADKQGRARYGGLTPQAPPTHGSRPMGASAFGGAGGSGGSGDPSTSGGVGGGLLGVVQSAYRRALQVYDSPLTEHLYLTGPAMAPTLNWRGAKDAAARERLVVRLLRHPGPHNVFVGDVVAFHSPLALPDDVTHVMVRRVAAVEGDEMISSSDADPPFLIPPGHCWVLADNSELQPEAGEVIDSRSYGHIPFSAVIGRVVYAASSRATHGPVRNNPAHSEAGGEDAAVVAAEVDVERIIREEERGERGLGSDSDEDEDGDGGSGGDEGEEKEEGAGSGRGGQGSGRGGDGGSGRGRAEGGGKGSEAPPGGRGAAGASGTGGGGGAGGSAEGPGGGGATGERQ